MRKTSTRAKYLNISICLLQATFQYNTEYLAGTGAAALEWYYERDSIHPDLFSQAIFTYRVCQHILTCREKTPTSTFVRQNPKMLQFEYGVVFYWVSTCAQKAVD